MEIKKTDNIEDVLKKLEEGVTEVFNSDTYKKYLDFIGKFHNYSYTNTLLIFLQKPDATLCAGYKTWEKMGRHVNKGETGIRIIAPVQYKREVEQELKDPDTGEVVKDVDGNPWKERITIKPRGYKIITIFDVGQTSGAELPEFGVKELQGDVKDYETIIAALCKVAPVPVSFEDFEGGAKGYYSLAEKKIVVRKGMSEEQTIKTLVHETAHAVLHDKAGAIVDGIGERKLTKNSIEVEAESVAYCVCKSLFGFDTGDYSFSYVTSWSQGKELKELKESLEVIQKTAEWMMEGIQNELKNEMIMYAKLDT